MTSETTPSSTPAPDPGTFPPPRRSVVPPLILGVALLVLVVVAIRRALVPATPDEPRVAAEERGKVLADYGAIAEFELVDQDGRTVTKKDLEGGIWVLDFFFTTCSGPCIDLTGKMKNVVAALGGEADVRFISLTVDPRNDRPETLARYARVYGATSDKWLWLTSRDGDEEPVKRLAASFHAAFGPKDEAGQLTHSTRINVIDRHGRLRAVCDTQLPGTWKEDVLHAVRLLLEQQPRGAPPAAAPAADDAPADG